MEDDLWGSGSPSDTVEDGNAADNDDSDDSSSSSSSSSKSRSRGIARALQEEEEGLDEARLAAEQIVMPLQQPVELLPRSELVRKAQVALCGRLGLKCEVVGSGTEAKVRVLPTQQPRTQPGASNRAVVAEEAAPAAEL